MKEWPVSSISIAGFVGLYTGTTLYAIPEIHALQNTVVAVLIPLCAPLCLYLGIATWKRKQGFWGYVTLLATSGISGAALGLALMYWGLD